LGRSAKAAGIELEKMITDHLEVGDDGFVVLLNGYNGEDWLWSRKISAVV
jgi:hypothetical protein